MKSWYAATATVALMALATAGCQRQPKRPPPPGRPLVVADKLDCPDSQGKLSRQSVAADGQSCVYTSADGATVTLQRASLDGKSSDDFLKGLETSVSAGMPKHGDLAAAASAEAKAGDSKSSDNKTGEWSEGNVKVESHHSHDKADIDLPGLHIHADGTGKASVRLPGISVDADDDKALVKTSWGGMKNAVIDADKTGAEIRAVNSDSANVDVIYILASDAPGPDDVHVVGYEARGPASGPLILATFKGKRYEHHDHEHYGSDAQNDVKKLIERNLK
jgi:hypothetical protein